MRYSAFISYNYRDKPAAVWLHRALETYRLPKQLRGRDWEGTALDARLPPVFRDRDELAASSDLGEAVKQALAESAYLIVICSPNGAKSRWVNEEIRTFAALGRADRIRLLIVGGEPHAADPVEECLPSALSDVFTTEPLAADLRPGQDGRTGAKLKLIASMLGVPYDELRQREAHRRQQRLALIATAASIGFVVMAALTAFALLSRAEAVEQRDLARQRTLTAERTVRFVQSMFSVSDPSEARGAAITAREVLDRGRAMLERDLDDEPAVKAELGTTLGEVYGSLGLFAESDRLIRRTFALRHGQPGIRARQLLALGDSQFRIGQYQAAVASLREAVDLSRSPEATSHALLARMLVRLGECYSALDRVAEALRVTNEALQIDLRTLGPDHSDTARDWAALGLVHWYNGDRAAAKPPTERALAIRMRREGALSPSIADDLNTLASIAMFQGDLDQAERLFRRNLAIDERVLGKDHPDLAATLINLAQTRVYQRAFAEAAPLLERALAINLKQRAETHDDMTFLFANLGLARRGQGRLTEADALLRKGLRAAELNKHSLLAPIMIDLAELHCATGRVPEGLGMARAARPIMAAAYPDEPWRTAWSDSVIGGCLLRGGAREEAARLIRASGGPIGRFWKPGTYFRHESDHRLALLDRASG